MKASEYMFEAKNVSGVMGRNSDVKVVFGGQDACTDGKLITLPSVNEHHEMSDVDVKVARGYVDHEAAHVKWTDNKAWSRIMKEQEDGTDMDAFHGTVNALEDVRIEGKLLNEYSGSRDNLDAVADAVGKKLRDNLDGQSLGELSAREVGALAATWYGRGRKSYGRVGAEMFKEIDPAIQEIVMQHVDKIDDKTTLEDVADLATSMMTSFDKHDKRDEEEEEEEKTAGDDESTSVGGGDETKESGKSVLPSETEETSESTGPAKMDEGHTEGAEGKSKGKVLSEDDVKEDVLKAATGSDVEMSDLGYRRFSDELDEVFSQDKLLEDQDKFTSIHEEMVGQINVIRRKLERKLMSKVQRGWHGGQTKGRLDSRRLVGAYTGSESVYKSRDVGDDLDVAVMIAVDHSGSMRHKKRIWMAQKAVIALAEALEPTQVKLSIQGFKTKKIPTKWHKQFREDTAAGATYSSISPILLLEYKKFEQPLHRCRSVIGGMIDSFYRLGSYHNIDGASVKKLGEQMLHRKEKRKILMVMSDGMPEDDEMRRDQMGADLKAVIDNLESKGVEVFGVGIQTNAVERFYRWNTVVSDTSDLEKELIDRISNVLIGGHWDGGHARKAS